MTPDEDYLLKRYRDIKQNGWGKGDFQVQETSTDYISVLITAGEAKRFVLRKEPIED